jgi:glycosyltransferase involved in cell wall biosynthesis
MTSSIATDTPLVSVITLAYNHERWIREAIQRILDQKVEFSFELLVAEDCSTDGTREVVFDYAKRHPDVVKVVTSDENVGGRLNGKRAHGPVRGKYIAYCEGDDYWNDDQTLAKLVGFLEANPDYGMVHTHANLYMAKDGSITANAQRMPADLDDDDAYFEILTRRREIVSSSVCVRKSILDEVFANNEECFAERFLMGDTQRWMEVARLTKVKCIHEPLVTYRHLEESYTKSKDPNKILNFTLNIRLLSYHYLDKYPCPDEVRDQVRERMSLSVLRRAYDAGHTQHAEDAMSELRSLGKPIPLRARLMVFGSKSPTRHTIARPFLKLDELRQRAFAKLRRLTRSN